MTLVVPSMLGAVAGFISKHGAWPTRLVVPADNWQAYRDNPEPVLRSHDNLSTRAVFSRLELVPVPGQLYVAVDAEGRWFHYGAEEGPDDWWGVVSGSVGAREDGQADGPVPAVARPIPNSYGVPGTRLAAGEYPGSPPTSAREDAEEKLAAFVRAGITAFIDLTDPTDNLAPYDAMLRDVAGRLGARVSYQRHTIRDMDICAPEHMRRVLDAIDVQIDAGQAVYVHCWGGIGPTGMVVGCWLVRHGASGADALRQVDALFRRMSPDKVRRHARWGSPQTDAQRAVVRDWREAERAATAMASPELRTDGEASPGRAPRHRRDGTGRRPLREALSEWCARRDVEPTFDDEAHVRFVVEGDDAPWPCALWLDDASGRFVLYVYPTAAIPYACVPAMLDAVARANYGLMLGNFEYDVRDGEVRFKISACCSADGVSPLDIDQLVAAGVRTMVQYYPALADVAQGADAALAITIVEGDETAVPPTAADEGEEIALDAIHAEIEERAAKGAEDERDERWKLMRPRADVTPAMRDRMRGALIGLAVGDAVGTSVEFRRPGSFPPVTDMTGGGLFRLQAGQWTDDTSMALCLAESLIECRRFDAADQMRRYLRWRDEGHLSSTGECFDIGNTVGAALQAFEESGEPFSGPTGEMTAGNGSLMRLAPVPVFYVGRAGDLIAVAGESSRTTHGASVAVDACRYLAALIAGAIRGATKDELLAGRYEPLDGYWNQHPLHPVIAAIADGSFRAKEPPAICGSGYAAHALEAALWAFSRSDDFRQGCLLAVNLGDDADTTAAIFGQLAGAFYGESGIPKEWRGRIAHKPLIDRFAEMLFQLAFGGPPAMGVRNAQAREEAERMVAAADGDPARAICEFLDAEERTKREMGVAAYYMNGPVSAQAVREELLLHLRVALGLAVLCDAD